MGGWGWEGSPRGRAYMRTIADSLCCTAELTQHCKAIISQLKKKKLITVMSRIVRCNQSATKRLAAFLQGMAPHGTVGDMVNVVWSLLDRRSPCCFSSCESHKQWGYERQRLADIHLLCHPVHMAAECIFWGGCFWWALTWNTKIHTSCAQAHRFIPLCL